MIPANLRALLLAPPGAGKGTQGEQLAQRAGVPHLATGDLLRAHVDAGTPLGQSAKEYMDAGQLVPDELVVALINEEMSTSLPGFVLDGFPRTLTQAEGAYEWGRRNGRTFHAVLFLDVPDEELVRRLLERGASSGRTDDNAETILARLNVYRQETAPLFDYYRERGILHVVDGEGTVYEVAARIDDALAATVTT